MSSVNDETMGRQLSELFRQDSAQARLPVGTWNAISPRMGEPDAPGIMWRLRRLWPAQSFRQPGMTRYLAPAATVAFVALVIAMLIFFMNNSDSSGPVPVGSPTPSAQFPTPAASPALTREQAMTLAADVFAVGTDAVTSVDDPHDMVARLMRVRDLPKHPGGDLEFVSARHEDTLVWLAQVEGTSRPTQAMLDQGAEDITYRFNAVAIDAVSGETVSRVQSQYEPFILPLELLPEQYVNAGIDERNIRRDSLPITEDAARSLVAVEFGDFQALNIDAVELSLVRYSSPDSGSGSIGPTATPTAAATAGDRELFVPSGRATSVPLSTSTPTSDRLSWLVILPPHMEDSFGCGGSGGPGGATHRLTCWMVGYSIVVDVETGETLFLEQLRAFGPRVTAEERNALQRFAWAEGWWALWHEVREYNLETLPEGLAAQLDRPDAPTPTPYPPTATPPADATPTSTPTPVPSPTAAPTSTPAPMRIERVASFGSPVSGTVFDDLLARVPDDEFTRQMVDLSDIAGTNERYGLQAPEPGTDPDDESVMAYGQRVNDLYMQDYPVDINVWPSEMRRYTRELNWFPYLSFDIWSATQTISMTSGGPLSRYDIAFGQFDSQATADALTACGCDQPEIRVHNGTEYYAWGEEGIGEINRRFDPPMYDHVGRGPRLLVRDGEAYYSIFDEPMKNIIDMLNGDVPSLADDGDYLLTAQWLATLGDMATMSFSSAPITLDGSGYYDVEAIASAPLLKPFDMAASGIGHDGERLFVGIVIANPDEATAQQNADLLEQRLREGLNGIGDSTWEETIELAEISVEGRLIVARLYLRNTGQRYVSALSLVSLAVSE